MHAVESFLNAYQGASTSAIRKGLKDAGVPDNAVLIFSDVDGRAVAVPDRQRGHDLLLVDPGHDRRADRARDAAAVLGVIDDMWFHWVTDFGLPGPDRGAGGKYLLVPPGYTGELPDSGYFVEQVRTSRACCSGARSWRTTTPRRPVALIKKTLKIYPLEPGGYGTSIGAALAGRASLGAPEGHLDWSFLAPAPPRSSRAAGVINTVPPERLQLLRPDQQARAGEPAARSTPRSRDHSRPSAS